ncbi:hypothetical protein GCM10010492_61280 [Saccharothrix mutabilis subsp. mutabilis]|uniref:CHAT domain-containing protein n=1 Tax=Saccharothrix mutabilis subsp. mutabilis TaxID=66855 RepID=A0ABN0UJA4_9PSEU
MAYSGFDHRLLDAFRRAGVSWTRTYLVQRVLRAVSGTTLFSRHVSALAGMASELPRTRAVLENFADTSQPRVSLLRSLCEGTRAAVERGIARWGPDPVLLEVRDVLDAVITVLDDQIRIPMGRRRELAREAAGAVGALLPDVREFLESTFTVVWEGPESFNTVAGLDLLSDELACLVAATDRDHDTLCRELADGVDRLDARSVLDLLLPRPKRYRVAVVVHGATALSHLSVLDPTATSAALTEPERLGFGSPNRLRAFVREVPTHGAACLASCQVDAVDAPSAGRAARRTMSELLDQYMAGHRLVTLSLGDDVLVSDVDRQVRHLPPRRTTVKRADPLVPGWPRTLRNGLRMAHVARVTEAPLPAAALAWAALEACGLENRGDLAAALALQALRQQVVEAHQQLHQSATAVVRAARSRVEVVEQRSSALDRALEACPSNHPDYAPLHARASHERAELAAARRRRRAAEADLTANLAVVNSYAKTDGFTRLHDLNTWVDLLLPPRPADPPALAAARDALTRVLEHTSPLAAQQVSDWSHRLADPAACGAWLRDSQQRIATFLDALYTARNLTFHSGQFRTEGDLVLGTGGSHVVDFSLEVLGNWYRNTPDPDTAPTTIITELAQRQRSILARLRKRAKPLFTLDVARLTGPPPTDVWGRP